MKLAISPRGTIERSYIKRSKSFATPALRFGYMQYAVQIGGAFAYVPCLAKSLFF